MPIYLQYGSIQGDATQQDHTGWMDITSMHWSVSRNVNTTVGSAANREASEPNLSEVTLTKISDSSHAELYQAATTGNTPQTAQIDLVSTGQDGKTYCSYILHDALLSGFSSGTSGDRPTETLTFNFVKKEVVYNKIGADGTQSGTSRAMYDQSSAGGSASGA